MSETVRAAEPRPGSGGRTPEKWFWFSMIGWVIYSAVWSWISLLRVYAFRASVYDLGVFAQEAWRTYSVPMGTRDFVLAFFNQGGGLYLAPLALGGYPLIVSVQSVALGSGAIFAYLIARRYSLSGPKAFAVSAAYLFYFPLTGINWDDAHYEAFLVPLFLLGVWLFLRGNYRASLFAMFWIAPLQYPLGFYPLWFAVQTLAPIAATILALRLSSNLPAEGTSTWGRRWIQGSLERIRSWRLNDPGRPVPTWYPIGLLASTGAVVLGGYLTNRLFYPLNGLTTLSHATSANPFVDLPLKGLSIALLLAPLVFLPLLSPRWIQFCLPFFGLMLFANYYGYIYPGLVTSWYTCLVLPFLLLGTIDAISKLERQRSWPQLLVAAVRARRSSAQSPAGAAKSAPDSYRLATARRLARPGNAAVVAVVVAVAITASFLTPYGPWNSETAADFALGSVTGYSPSLYAHFEQLASLIPRSATAVILQDNMPTLLPRPLPPGDQSPLVAGPADVVSYNLSWANPNGGWTPIDPEYVIGNPNALLYSFFNASGAYPFNTSMQQILGELYGSGNYGILGEANGMIVLEHGFTGTIQYYVPYEQTFAPSSFSSTDGVWNSPSCSRSCLVVSDQFHDQVSWFGPYTYLSPGFYDVTFHIALERWTGLDNVTLDVTQNYGSYVFGHEAVTGPYEGTNYLEENVTIPISVYAGAPAVEFRAIGSYYTGSLILYGVTVTQTAPPPTTTAD